MSDFDIWIDIFRTKFNEFNSPEYTTWMYIRRHDDIGFISHEKYDTSVMSLDDVLTVLYQYYNDIFDCTFSSDDKWIIKTTDTVIIVNLEYKYIKI